MHNLGNKSIGVIVENEYSYKYPQLAIICSKLTIKTLEQGVKYIQS